ncbi:MAG TPA: cobaltochelatase subunit CobN [Mesorhizobium sp.]|jgi:cobaltochelatase CobN|nr:cobaltochelatase subunit CobN [Mesorhizobium sp.]
MHLLATSSASLDDLVEPVDLDQRPGEIVVLSFSDSDLAAIGRAWTAKGSPDSSLRLARLAELRHPMSVDLWIDKAASRAKVILVRILGGYDWWRYGCDCLAELSRERGIKLALLPGECRDEDVALDRLSTLPDDELRLLLGYFREGGLANMDALLDRLAFHAGRAEAAPPPPAPLDRMGFYDPDHGIQTIDAVLAGLPAGTPVVPILFYRSVLLAADADPIDALHRVLKARGMAPVPLFASSLKDGAVCARVEDALKRLNPALIVATTAFALSPDDEGCTMLDRLGAPVLQALLANTRREAWEKNGRGLAPADLAMHVVLPEIDGRVLAGAISFKAEREIDPDLSFRGQFNRPEPSRIEAVATRAAELLRLQQTPPAERRVAILLPDYPAAAGRTGYAVGLDVPQSAMTMLHDLKAAGYRVEDIPESPRELLDLLRESEALSVESYRELFARIPSAAREQVEAAWGAPDAENDCDAFRFRAARFGNVTVALAPDRGKNADRRADYHDPTLPPRHALLAFGFWLREALDCHALVHLGAHGTLEWLPGKTVASSESCFPEIVTGGLPVVYPFIVSNPGEAAQAKRRIAAVTIGHLPPPLVESGLDENGRALERLIDEYAQADGLDRRRRDRLAKLIVEKAQETGLAKQVGVDGADDPDTALARIDAWLCDIKDFAIKDGLHVFGRAASGETDPLRLQSAAAERGGLLAALDGRHVSPGPSGAPARGRLDVLPTGRNLFTSDPRHLPTPTGFELGKMAAEEVLRRYAQDHGDWPRSLVLDLWGSASLRTGGEEIAQGLWLMGCRPQWDAATGRVSGVEVLPPASLGRPRVDVSFRISGLFRDMFPTQIALLDAAAKAIAARDEAPGDNPLAELSRAENHVPPRVFGSSPGTYGAGVEELLASGDWERREEIGETFLAATSHGFGGPEGEGFAAPGAFRAALEGADLLVHVGDDSARDLLDGSADVSFIGGFSAALAALGRHADVIALDTTDPKRPRARPLAQALARVVHARATNPRFVEGQMRHGPRGAAEFAETVDRLIGFAETTSAIPSDLIDAVHAAYVENPRVRAFMLRENPAAARAIAERFAAARRRGLWHPLRNSVDGDLMALIAEAQGLEQAA